MHLIAPSLGPLDISQAQQVSYCQIKQQEPYCLPRAVVSRSLLFVVPHCRLQSLQVLSDSNGDFAVIGICSADAASSSVVAALGSLLSGQQQQAAAATAAAPGSLQGLRMHVSATSTLLLCTVQGSPAHACSGILVF
jgi:hypothetical protein